jgi:drug/metabolite transporter (DMT)-like permease
MGAVSEHKTRAWLLPLLGLGLLSVSTAAVLVRLAGRAIPGEAGLDGLSVDDSLAIAFWRISLASILLVPCWLSSERRDAVLTLPRAQKIRLLVGGLLLGLHFALWLSSLAYTTVASSVLLVTTTPIWVGLLSPWIVGESPSRRTWAGIAIALLGAIVVALQPSSSAAGSHALLGNALALGGALTASGYLMLGRRLRASLDFLAYTAATLAGAWLVLAVTVLAMGITAWGYSAAAWGLLVLLALVPQLLGHGSLTFVLRWIGAEVVAVVLLGEPIGAAVLAWLVLGELPERSVLLGGPLLLVGLAIVLSGGINRRLSDSGGEA